jgi:hypothetical protein
LLTSISGIPSSWQDLICQIEYIFYAPVVLARISRQISAAAADPGMSTALRSVGFLDVL